MKIHLSPQTRHLKMAVAIMASLILSIVIGSTPPIHAQEQQNRDRQPATVILDRNAVVNGPYFAKGDDVTISGTVNGDAFVAGGNVDIEGTINGDLLVAGGNITINGTVANNVRVAGGNIHINGKVGRNVAFAGGNIKLLTNSSVAGNVVGAGGKILIQGPVQQGVYVEGGDLTIDSPITGDVRAAVGNLRMAPNARVSGSLEYWSEAPAQIQQGAVISGQVTKQNAIVRTNKLNNEKNRQFFSQAELTAKFINLLSSILLGLLFLKFLPRFTRQTVDNVSKRPLLSLGIGTLALIVTPIIAVILMITVIGIPLGIILLIYYALLCYITGIFVAIAVGELIYGYTKSTVTEVGALVVGLVVYTLLSLVPVLNVLVGIAVLLVGLGALVLAHQDVYREKRV